MMKNLFLSLMVITAALSSCSGSSSSGGNTPEEKAVSYVKKQLKRQGKLVDYQIVNGQLPIEMMADDFKAYRDAVFKARLDYRACQVRGLKAGMEKAVATITECQEGIKSKVDELSQAQTGDEHIFVLGTVEKKGNGNKFNIVVAFNPETMEMEKWETVTTPIQNNAILLTNALSESLLNYGMRQDENLDSLANTVNDPVVKFILTSRAI